MLVDRPGVGGNSEKFEYTYAFLHLRASTKFQLLSEPDSSDIWKLLNGYLVSPRLKPAPDCSRLQTLDLRGLGSWTSSIILRSRHVQGRVFRESKLQSFLATCERALRTRPHDLVAGVHQ